MVGRSKGWLLRGIAVAAHPADGVEPRRVECKSLDDGLGAKVHGQHLAQHDLARTADPQADIAPAFERRRQLADPRAGDVAAGHARSARPRQLVDLRRRTATAQTFIASRMASLTMLTVNSSGPAMLRTVSLGVSSSWFSMPSATIAGSADRQLKKLKGAALTRPSAPIVVTSAIGQGTTVPIRIL